MFCGYGAEVTHPGTPQAMPAASPLADLRAGSPAGLQALERGPGTRGQHSGPGPPRRLKTARSARPYCSQRPALPAPARAPFRPAPQVHPDACLGSGPCSPPAPVGLEATANRGLSSPALVAQGPGRAQQMPSTAGKQAGRPVLLWLGPSALLRQHPRETGLARPSWDSGETKSGSQLTGSGHGG